MYLWPAALVYPGWKSSARTLTFGSDGEANGFKRSRVAIIFGRSLLSLQILHTAVKALTSALISRPKNLSFRIYKVMYMGYLVTWRFGCMGYFYELVLHRDWYNYPKWLHTIHPFNFATEHTIVCHVSVCLCLLSCVFFGFCLQLLDCLAKGVCCLLLHPFCVFHPIKMPCVQSSRTTIFLDTTITAQHSSVLGWERLHARSSSAEGSWLWGCIPPSTPGVGVTSACPLSLAARRVRGRTSGLGKRKIGASVSLFFRCRNEEIAFGGSLPPFQSDSFCVRAVSFPDFPKVVA